MNLHNRKLDCKREYIKLWGCCYLGPGGPPGGPAGGPAGGPDGGLAAGCGCG